MWLGCWDCGSAVEPLVAADAQLWFTAVTGNPFVCYSVIRHNFYWKALKL